MTDEEKKDLLECLQTVKDGLEQSVKVATDTLKTLNSVMEAVREA